MQFTNLWHHVYDVNRLRKAYYGLNQRIAPGIDGQRWSEYGEKLEENLKRLSGRLREGHYRATAVRRHYIEKNDGRMHPIGIPTLEDKIQALHGLLWVEIEAAEEKQDASPVVF